MALLRFAVLLHFEQIAQYKKSVAEGQNPRDVKVALAQEIVTRFHSKQAAEDALADFVNRPKAVSPDDVPEMNVTGAQSVIAHLLKQTGLCASISEAIQA